MWIHVLWASLVGVPVGKLTKCVISCQKLAGCDLFESAIFAPTWLIELTVS